MVARMGALPGRGVTNTLTSVYCVLECCPEDFGTFFLKKLKTILIFVKLCLVKIYMECVKSPVMGGLGSGTWVRFWVEEFVAFHSVSMVGVSFSCCPSSHAHVGSV